MPTPIGNTNPSDLTDTEEGRPMVETLTEPMAHPSERTSGCPFDPPAPFRQLRSEEPITRVGIWDGSTPWLVSKYADGTGYCGPFKRAF
jgi:hypothetical protein